MGRFIRTTRCTLGKSRQVDDLSFKTIVDGGVNMRLSLLFLTAIVIILSTFGCSKVVNNNSLPTDKQIGEFIEKNKIQAIQEKNLFNEITVILYKDSSEAGFFMVYQDHTGKLHTKKVSGTLIPNKPVYLSGSATNLPFVTVILGEEILEKSPNKVEVTFEDGTAIEADITNKTGIIIPYTKKIEGNLSYTNLIIISEDDVVIYEKNKIQNTK